MIKLVRIPLFTTRLCQTISADIKLPTHKKNYNIELFVCYTRISFARKIKSCSFYMYLPYKK